ncbi:hypothetical protein [Vibrio sp. ABG19]|uniref:hypothetical protein n=1 Tax=Vibrio sp. ABG19 TaxID=2817385 RepID=UPI00249F7F32|nr:hypothetical protein [Vibrio sp. ABG19]WGY45003.1 hypothetical protein J0X00_04680 [Vibrio sp. ABG19]
MRTAINSSLTLLFFLTAFLSSAAFASSEENTCPIGVTTGIQTWDQRIYGDAPYLCLGNSGNCRYRLDYSSICSNDGSYDCYGSFVSTGGRCTESEGQGGNMMWPGGDVAVEPDEPGGGGSDGGSDGGDSGTDDGSDGGSGEGTGEDGEDGQDGEPDDSDNDTTEIQNRINMRCNPGLLTCSGEVSVNPAITAYLKNIWQYAGYMSREGMPFIRESLEHEIPQMIYRTQDLVEDGNNANATALNSLNSAVSALSGNLQAVKGDTGQVASLYGMANYYFPALMNNTSGLLGQFGGVNGRIDQTNGYLNELTNTTRMGNGEILSYLEQNSAAINALSSNVDALASQMGEGTGEDIDMSGVESRLDGIQSTLDGDGLSGRSFEGKVDFESNSLYSEGAIEELQAEIETLEDQYQKQMGQFKSLFSFDASELNPGEYVEHKWQFHFMTGETVNFSSGVFPALLSNANLIAAILLFIAVMAGIRALTD